MLRAAAQVARRARQAQSLAAASRNAVSHLAGRRCESLYREGIQFWVEMETQVGRSRITTEPISLWDAIGGALIGSTALALSKC